MKGEYVVKINGKLITYSDYNDIPDRFDHLIKFLPEVPPGPHTHEQHKQMEMWIELLQQLIAKEKANHV